MTGSAKQSIPPHGSKHGLLRRGACHRARRRRDRWLLAKTERAIPKRCEAMRDGIASSLALLAMTSLTSRTITGRDRIDDPYRRWRLPARNQYLRADEGDL